MSITARGCEIAIRRIGRGWDKSTLAKQAKLNHSIVVRAERGDAVSAASAKAIADALDATVFELFELSGRSTTQDSVGYAQ